MVVIVYYAGLGFRRRRNARVSFVRRLDIASFGEPLPVNPQTFGELIRLRYKLMWAKTRSRNGRIALFFAGYLLLVMLFAIFVSGGFGAGMIAVRSGRAEMVARIVFSGLFVQALVASISLGFGVNVIFSELELRRYPIRGHERFLVRHTIGLLDPFWILFLLLELGLVVGLYVYGATPLGAGFGAVLLLFLSNYALARLITSIIDRMMQGKSGSLLLMVSIICVGILPSMLGPIVKKNAAAGDVIVKVLGFTPPFGAAAAATRAGAPQAVGLLTLVLWLAALIAALVAIERLPAWSRRPESGKVTWQDWYERLAAAFAPEDAPFVAHWLRFYARNTRFRTMYLLTLPLLAFLIFNFTRTSGPEALFPSALGIFAIAGFLSTSRMAVNQYGYTGGGFRRFFLLPTDPAASLRAGVYASMLLGGVLVPLVLIGWIVLAPVPFDARAVLMLFGSAVTGLFAFHAAGLWVSMLNPRKGNYYSNFGNDLSLWGNILLIGGVLLCIFLPQLLRKRVPALVDPGHWWITLITLILSVVFFRLSLRGAGELFRNRRERLLAVVEGRD
jgi:hypothetical protein